MGTLYVVGTPIGNLQDITLRALEVLKSVDLIACEDTRHSIRLLNAYDIHKHLVSCRAENEERSAAGICGLLSEGKNVAYVTDAGTPSLSDPGAHLVRAARSQGFPVVPIPGPSALATLASAAGAAEKSLLFEGFLSPKPGKRRARLRDLLEREEAFILYESPFRIVKLMREIADLSPDRRVIIGREMTKVHEEYLDARADVVLQELQSRERLLGEFSVLVSGKKMA